MLLWASQGITGRAGNFFLRAAPSAGALYPVETYLSVQNVETIDAGLFHFQPAEFSLDKLSGDFFGNKIAEAALGQSFLAQAGVVFIWSAILRKNFSKYGHRGMRYILMDAGHISQNLLLAAEALEFERAAAPRLESWLADDPGNFAFDQSLPPDWDEGA